MLGNKARSFGAINNVSLEDLVPANHFYRHLERSLDLRFIRTLVQPLYAVGGRPSIDPVIFFKLQLVMFFEGIRSERQLMRVAADRLSVRWYLGYDLHEALPDHSSLTRIRDRYGITIFRRFFDHIVEQCCQAGLVWGKELYLDSTQVEANAAKDVLRPRFYVDAINEHLAALFPDVSDGDILPAPEPTPIQLYATVDPEVKVTLTARNTGRHDWIAKLGRQERKATHGYYQRQADIWVNTTDADATMMHKKGGGSAMGYHTHYVVDGGKARIILTALVTPSEVMDNQPMLDLLWHSRFRWHLPLKQVTGDTTMAPSKTLWPLNRLACMPICH